MAGRYGGIGGYSPGARGYAGRDRGLSPSSAPGMSSGELLEAAINKTRMSRMRDEFPQLGEPVRSRGSPVPRIPFRVARPLLRRLPWAAVAMDLYDWYMREPDFYNMGGWKLTCRTAPSLIVMGPFGLLPFTGTVSCGGTGWGVDWPAPSPEDANWWMWSGTNPAGNVGAPFEAWRWQGPLPARVPTAMKSPDAWPWPHTEPWQNGLAPDAVFSPKADRRPGPEARELPGVRPDTGPGPTFEVFPNPGVVPETKTWPQRQGGDSSWTRWRSGREKKVRGRIPGWQAVGKITEGLDLLESFHDALPKDCKTKVKKNVFLSKKTGKWTSATPTDARGRPITHPRPQDMAKDVAKCWTRIDWDKAIENIVLNEIQDRVIGKLSQGAQKGSQPWFGSRPVGVGAGSVM